ncbi:hypothetical protein SELMODRAFT_442369 [Selaginella moellendorffii]|uniref:Uncharacterized protein n=1 Tax=Selaginella moellendorffii TaxID=88036 RepID=D8RSW6_SELML|nr:uncharacterized protein LOC9657106 [Selaginella moellendorffii]EFJ25142.1 hypothetical protein SELMODRAFT_442369 [Selaginella moellendorffii]|eukprot:XP_002974187.1 uncharacterized protein LOC9657106 [Selaginella moellendorffii]
MTLSKPTRRIIHDKAWLFCSERSSKFYFLSSFSFKDKDLRPWLQAHMGRTVVASPALVMEVSHSAPGVATSTASSPLRSRELSGVASGAAGAKLKAARVGFLRLQLWNEYKARHEDGQSRASASATVANIARRHCRNGRREANGAKGSNEKEEEDAGTRKAKRERKQRETQCYSQRRKRRIYRGWK